MKVLITNLWLDNYAGTEVYVRDLAIALKSAGIEVEVYTQKIGRIAEEIKSHGINVADSIDSLKNIPDLIHGHHKVVSDAINKFPNIPAVYFCHSGYLIQEEPTIDTAIKKYIAVDEFCLERLTKKGISGAEIIYNWVDTNKFKQKAEIRQIPTRALVFSNTNSKQKININRACKRLLMQLDSIGNEYNNTITSPESVIGNYDIVFAKAKCAIEAMACGCAVILSDYEGIGEMITPDNFDYARRFNFGYKMLSAVEFKEQQDKIIVEISKYNPMHIKMVSDKIREDASFDKAINKIIKLYNNILGK